VATQVLQKHPELAQQKPRPAAPSPELIQARRALTGNAGRHEPASTQQALATAAVLRAILATPVRETLEVVDSDDELEPWPDLAMSAAFHEAMSRLGLAEGGAPGGCVTRLRTYIRFPHKGGHRPQRHVRLSELVT
jgi:hypothetical protein